MLATLLALAVQGSVQEPPRLAAGETLEGEIADGDPVVHTPALDKSYTDAPVVGKTVRIEIDSAGLYTLELRSYSFDAYLVLRNGAGEILAEDDDGLLGTHSRIVVELAPGAYSLAASALHGQRGGFELKLQAGRPRELSPPERAAAEREDMQRQLSAMEVVRGPEHPDTATCSNNIGLLLWSQGDFAAARPYLERALAIREKVLGAEHPDTAASLENLADMLYAQGDYTAARPYYERALAIREKALGPEHPDTATSLNSLALVLYYQGDYIAARPLFERALAIREKALETEHSDTASSLNGLALVHQAQGDYAAARTYFERALAIEEKALGTEDSHTAMCLENLGLLFQAQGNYADARPYFERALAICEKTLGPEHSDTATVLNNLASLLQDQGEYAAARTYYERALRTWEKVLGPEHPHTAACLNNLAVLLYQKGDYAAARPLYERALAIAEKTLGPEHSLTATNLDNLAGLLQDQGDSAAAQPLYERALAIREKTLGKEHPDTATSLVNLARFLRAKGDYAAARPLFERAYAINERALGPEHIDSARSLENLALLLWDQGDYGAARPYLERALAICEKALGPEHPDTARSLENLAGLLRDQGDYATARPYLERALAIQEKALGPEHPDTATSLESLALVLQDQGDYATARPYFERALAIDEKALGPEHQGTASDLNYLALLLHAQGDYAAAQSCFERALAIRERTLGPEHPDTARTRYNLGTLLADAGFGSDSLSLARQALTSSLAHAQGTLWSLSERERLLFLREGDDHLRLILSLAARRDQGTHEAVAYELSLAWRGLVSRTLLESRARLRASLPEKAGAAIENLYGVQARLSKLLYATEIPDREQQEREIHDLRERRNELEVEVQRAIGPTQERPVTIAELRAHLEPSSALLDFLVHSLYEPAAREGDKVVRKGEWSADHVSAWIVRPDRELVHLDLGPAEEIESAVKGYLAEIVSRRGVSGGSAAGESGTNLHALLWKPLAEKLDGIQRVFVRADSFLGTLPFEVIPLADGKYVIEDKDFVYVQTPNDLVQRKEPTSDAPPSLLAVGGVDFKKRAELEHVSSSTPIVVSAALGGELRGSLNQFWGSLTHTEYEATVVKDLFDSVFEKGTSVALTAAFPTEERLKQELPRYSVEHLATHGFFHPAGTVSMWDSAQEAAEKPELLGIERETHALVGELPGLLTGLVCAGANEAAPAGRDDGLLTAEEVLWLDLSKVELVVLSACETALGERRSGEGMIGLRRAFGLAGAKTVVSSLWSVKDQSTSELMQRFYQNLWRKHQGRAEALRNAQLEILAKNRASEHDALPSTWGAFVLSGEWR